MVKKSFPRFRPIPETKEELMSLLREKKSFPYWDDEYGKCYFKPRIAGKETTQYFVDLLGIHTKADCERIRRELIKK